VAAGPSATCRLDSSPGSVSGPTYLARMTDSAEDHRQGLLRRLVLPDPHNCPAGARQGRVGTPISLDVAAQLRGPVPLIARGFPAVDWAHVPEAAIDEHSDLASGEDDVRADADAGQVETVVLPEAIAPGMEGRPQADLGLGVDPSVGLHVAGAARVQWLRLPLAGRGVRAVGMWHRHQSARHEAGRSEHGRGWASANLVDRWAEG
jgi:hypothetical protein